MSTSDPIKRAWQDSVTHAEVPDIKKLHSDADRFYRHVRRRNQIEYAASVLVVACFTIIALKAPSPVTKLGAVLVVLGTLMLMWQLNRRASAVAPPSAESALPVLAHQRAQLVRQRDALASVGLWYLLPLAPGMGLMMFAPAFEHGPGVLLTMRWRDIASMAFIFAVFGGVWWINLRVAGRLQNAINEIDALIGEGR
jgi:hypothetical protein